MYAGGPALSIDEFIERWRGLVGGAERADYAMFLRELCTALDLPPPNPAGATGRRDRTSNGAAGPIRW